MKFQKFFRGATDISKKQFELQKYYRKKNCFALTAIQSQVKFQGLADKAKRCSFSYFSLLTKSSTVNIADLALPLPHDQNQSPIPLEQLHRQEGQVIPTEAQKQFVDAGLGEWPTSGHFGQLTSQEEGLPCAKDSGGCSFLPCQARNCHFAQINT